MKHSILAVLVLAIIGCRSRAPRAAHPEPDRVVVLLSVDGLAGFYLDDPNAQMPTIRALASKGARAQSMKAVTPTVTWPNHTTLVTGDMPARHGVVGNNYLDRKTLKPVVLIGDPIFDKDQIVKVPTIYDAAHDAGLKTLAIRWPASRNAKTLDWNLPAVHTKGLLNRYTTPSVIALARQEGLWPKLDHASDQSRADLSDPASAQLFIDLLKQHHPQLALLHLVDVDHEQHLHGPRTPRAYEAIQHDDALVGKVWDELKRDFPGRATLIVVSDHGFSPIQHLLLPNVVLQRAGIIHVAHDHVIDGPVRVLVQGGAAFIYVVDEAHCDEIIPRVKKAFDGMSGIEKVVSDDQFGRYGVADPKVDPHAPDLILFANEGWAFGDTAAGALPVFEKSEPSGTHGHDPDLPDLHATFVAWGEGIKSGARLGEIPNTDVAPTIAKLLGVPLPNVDGKPLDALLDRLHILQWH